VASANGFIPGLSPAFYGLLMQSGNCLSGDRLAGMVVVLDCDLVTLVRFKLVSDRITAMPVPAINPVRQWTDIIVCFSGVF
jgi:hypothetical protein